MSELTFFYGSMGSGKSVHLLTTAYNYKERNKKPLLLTSSVDDRYGMGKIASRLGIEEKAILISKKDNIFKIVSKLIRETHIDIVLVDEINFFTSKQIDQLSDVVDILNVNVFCYGIRTDFKSSSFMSTKRIMEIADNIIELKAICHCGKKAIINARIKNNKVEKDGPKILVGGNESYISLCRSCWKKNIVK